MSADYIVKLCFECWPCACGGAVISCGNGRISCCISNNEKQGKYYSEYFHTGISECCVYPVFFSGWNHAACCWLINKKKPGFAWFGYHYPPRCCPRNMFCKNTIIFRYSICFRKKKVLNYCYNLEVGGLVYVALPIPIAIGTGQALNPSRNQAGTSFWGSLGWLLRR